MTISKPLFVIFTLSLVGFVGCGGGSNIVPVTGPAYRLKDISNGSNVGAVAINNAGQVIVATSGFGEYPAVLRAARSGLFHSPLTSRDAVPEFAFLYSGGRFTTIESTLPRGLNDSGVIVGINGIQQNGSFTRIPSLGPPDVAANFSSYATAVNNASQVVGVAIAPNLNTSPPSIGTYHAFLYNGGQPLDMGTLGEPASGTGFSDSGALAINNSGQIVGASDTGALTSGGSPITHAFLYANGKMTDLGTLGGDDSEARAINNNGQVVGFASLANNAVTHAVLWQNGQAQDLGTAGYTSNARSINDAGQVVGMMQAITPLNAPSPVHAFIYREGKLLDLNKQVVNISGWTLQEATGINNQGQICGNGLYKGQSRAFLLTPQ